MYVTNYLSSYKLKILILGSANSGKHLLCKKYARGFDKKFETSIGVDIYVRDLIRPDGEIITFACWICAPYKKFEYYWPKFFRGAVGALVLFDITDRKSFEEAKNFVAIIHENINYVPIVLMGNKIDLEAKREIKYDEAFHFIKKYRLATYIEVSIKDDINVIASLEQLNNEIYCQTSPVKSETTPLETIFDKS